MSAPRAPFPRSRPHFSGTPPPASSPALRSLMPPEPLPQPPHWPTEPPRSPSTPRPASEEPPFRARTERGSAEPPRRSRWAGGTARGGAGATPRPAEPSCAGVCAPWSASAGVPGAGPEPGCPEGTCHSMPTPRHQREKTPSNETPSPRLLDSRFSRPCAPLDSRPPCSCIGHFPSHSPLVINTKTNPGGRFPIPETHRDRWGLHLCPPGERGGGRRWARAPPGTCRENLLIPFSTQITADRSSWLSKVPPVPCGEASNLSDQPASLVPRA